MNFQDPSRLRVGPASRPCWLGSELALPRLELEPSTRVTWSEAGTTPNYFVRVRDSGRSIWFEIEVGFAHIPDLLLRWNLDPEGTFCLLFHQESWPQRSEVVKPHSPASKPEVPTPALEDLI